MVLNDSFEKDTRSRNIRVPIMCANNAPVLFDIVVGARNAHSASHLSVLKKRTAVSVVFHWPGN